MDKYDEAPFVDTVTEASTLGRADAENLVFLEPLTTFMPFRWREFKISRSGFPITHGRVRTSTACQGKTFDQGVLIDCARRGGGQYPMHDDDWWLHLYVMLSRATSLDDILLVRPPEASFLLRGPPTNLRRRLELFRTRIGRGQKLIRQVESM